MVEVVDVVDVVEVVEVVETEVVDWVKGVEVVVLVVTEVGLVLVIAVVVVVHREGAVVLVAALRARLLGTVVLMAPAAANETSELALVAAATIVKRKHLRAQGCTLGHLVLLVHLSAWTNATEVGPPTAARASGAGVVVWAGVETQEYPGTLVVTWGPRQQLPLAGPRGPRKRCSW